jgi:hypothetical protein
MAAPIQTKVGNKAPVGTIDSCKEKAAEKQLSDWVAELDAQEGPKVQVSIEP